MKAKIFLSFMLPLVGASLYFFNGNFSEMSDEQIFSTFITEDRPTDVKIIWSKGNWWQGFSVALSFSAPQDYITKTISTYAKVSPELCHVRDFPAEMKIEVSECYSKNIKMREGGQAYFIIDRNKPGQLFFYAYGG